MIAFKLYTVVHDQTNRNNTLNPILSSLISQKVTLFFHGKLYRGNRALKVDARRFGAFDSPNCPPLATVEAGIEGMHQNECTAVGGVVSVRTSHLRFIHLT